FFSSRRRHTRSKRDWSSDVCSSDLRGRVRHIKDPAAIVAKWQELATANDWSIRQLVIAVTGRQQLVGTPEQVADEIERYVNHGRSEERRVGKKMSYRVAQASDIKMM